MQLSLREYNRRPWIINLASMKLGHPAGREFMPSRLPVIPILAVFAISLTPLVACAPAPREGQIVEIADESAVIIWDSASQTEHFIRRASFKTEATDFGFLVPTPSQPGCDRCQLR